jgi:putative transcription factor
MRTDNMVECTLCGRKTSEPFKIDYEGAIIEVCEECEHFGTVVGIPKSMMPEKPAKFSRPATLDTVVAGTQAEFSKDYGARIMKAREAKGLSRKDFANRLNERESLISRVESQSMEPDDALTKKIEGFLKIKLRDVGEASDADK